MRARERPALANSSPVTIPAIRADWGNSMALMRSACQARLTVHDLESIQRPSCRFCEAATSDRTNRQAGWRAAGAKMARYYAGLLFRSVPAEGRGGGRATSVQGRAEGVRGACGG